MLAAFALPVVLLELFFRAFLPQIQEHDQMFRRDSELGWTWEAAKSGVILHAGEPTQRIETNADGFRDDDFGPDDSESPRIWVVGDSFVSNVSVEHDAVFTEQLEAGLPGVRVMNLGVNGYSLVQESLLLSRLAERYPPDLILVQVYVRNDTLDNLDRGWPLHSGMLDRPWAYEGSDGTLQIVPPPATAREPLRAPPRWHVESFFRARRTELLWWLFPELDPKGPAGLRPPELTLCLREPGSTTQWEYRVARLLLDSIATFGRERGVPVGFVLAPSFVQVDPAIWAEIVDRYDVDAADYDLDRPQSVFRDWAKHHDHPMLDLLPILRERSQGSEPLYWPVEQHWTQEGNRVVAEAYLEFLRSEPRLRNARLRDIPELLAR